MASGQRIAGVRTISGMELLDLQPRYIISVVVIINRYNNDTTMPSICCLEFRQKEFLSCLKASK